MIYSYLITIDADVGGGEREVGAGEQKDIDAGEQRDADAAGEQRDGGGEERDGGGSEEEKEVDSDEWFTDFSCMMNEVLTELRGLCSYVGECFDSLDTRFAPAWIFASHSLKRMQVTFVRVSIFHHHLRLLRLQFLIICL